MNMSLSKEQSQVVKGGAIMLLLFHHLFYTANRFGPFGVTSCLLSEAQLIRVGYACRVCVWVFAFLSAYGITMQLALKRPEKTLSQFTYERWISLMSGFWFVYLVMIIFRTFTGKQPFSATYHGNIVYVLLDFFGFADFFGTSTLAGVWWYMCFAQIVVVVLPAIILLCRKLRGLTFLLSFLVIQYVPEDVGIISKFGGAYLQYLPVVILGVLCALDSRESKNRGLVDAEKKKRRDTLKALGALTLCVCLLVMRDYLTADGFPVPIRRAHWFLWSLSAMAFAYTMSRLFTGKASRMFAFFGKHSGNMFLIHIFFLYYVPGFIYYTKSVLLSWITLFVVSLICSVVLEELKQLVRYERIIRHLRK